MATRIFIKQGGSQSAVSTDRLLDLVKSRQIDGKAPNQASLDGVAWMSPLEALAKAGVALPPEVTAATTMRGQSTPWWMTKKYLVAGGAALLVLIVVMAIIGKQSSDKQDVHDAYYKVKTVVDTTPKLKAGEGAVSGRMDDPIPAGKVIADKDIFTACLRGRERFPDVVATAKENSEWATEALKDFIPSPRELGAYIDYADRKTLEKWLMNFQINGNIAAVERIAKTDDFGQFMNEMSFLHLLGTDDKNIPMMEVLIKYGADPNCKDRVFGTPVEYAIKMSKPKIVEFLKSHGAQ